MRRDSTSRLLCLSRTKLTIVQAVRKDWTAALNQSLVLGLLPQILRQFLHSYQCFQSLGPAVLGQRTQRRERFPLFFTCPALQHQRCAPCLMAAIENHVLQALDRKVVERPSHVLVLRPLASGESSPRKKQLSQESAVGVRWLLVLSVCLLGFCGFFILIRVLSIGPVDSDGTCFPQHAVSQNNCLHS